MADNGNRSETTEIFEWDPTWSEQDSAPPRLVVVYGAELGRHWTVESTSTVGRSTDQDLVLAHRTVSRRHAVLSWRNGTLEVHDQGSRNGLWINDRRVRGTQRLLNNDLLRLGCVVLKILDGNQIEARYHDELRRLAIEDGLTGLANRRFFDRCLGELPDAVAAGCPASLVMIDLDHFKNVNDRHGHVVGDLVLRHFARILAEVAPEGVTVARYGGEEFVLIMPGMDGDAAEDSVKALRDQVLKRPAKIGGLTVPLSFSAGIASGTEPVDPTTLFEIADACCLEAKGAGRDRWLRTDT